MIQHNKAVNTAEKNKFKVRQLATGYVSSTTIPFEANEIVVRIEAKGFVEFLNPQENLLASFNLPKQAEGRGVYTEVLYSEGDNAITLKFPIIEWIDNYPHCDGEFDRWDTKTIGYYTLEFNIQTNKITFN